MDALRRGLSGEKINKIYLGSELYDFEGELPHSMAAKGAKFIDLSVLIFGVLLIYFLFDLLFEANRINDGRALADWPGARSWKGATRRTFILAIPFVVFGASPIWLKKANAIVYRIKSANPRFKNQRQFAKLCLPTGNYLNERKRKKISIVHFVQKNGTVRRVYLNSLNPWLPEIVDKTTLDDPEKRIDGSARSQVIEWGAISHFTKGRVNDAFQLLDAVIQSKKIKSPEKIRYIDLLAGLHLRNNFTSGNGKSEYTLIPVIKLAENITTLIENENGKSTLVANHYLDRNLMVINKRIKKWETPPARWVAKWRAEHVTWNGIDI